MHFLFIYSENQNANFFKFTVKYFSEFFAMLFLFLTQKTIRDSIFYTLSFIYLYTLLTKVKIVFFKLVLCDLLPHRIRMWDKNFQTFRIRDDESH